jgi:hypothetical protein
VGCLSALLDECNTVHRRTTERPEQPLCMHVRCTTTLHAFPPRSGLHLAAELRLCNRWQCVQGLECLAVSVGLAEAACESNGQIASTRARVQEDSGMQYSPPSIGKGHRWECSTVDHRFGPQVGALEKAHCSHAEEGHHQQAWQLEKGAAKQAARNPGLHRAERERDLRGRGAREARREGVELHEGCFTHPVELLDERL